MKIALAFAAAMTLVLAQDKPADPKPNQKVAKDQAEADLINSLPKETDPAKHLEILEKWSKAYPETAFSDERDHEYLSTYQTLKKPREAFDKAKEIVSKHPNDFLALYTLIAYVPYLNNGNPPAADMDTAETAANHIVKDADAVFAADNKPAGMDDKTWASMKTTTIPLAQKTIPMITVQRKDWPKAEQQLTEALKADPSQAQMSFMLANAYFSQRQVDPKKQPPAIFEFARAGSYDGPNALPAPARQQAMTTFNKLYNAYHGSAEGADKVIALAKTNALPPDGFTIDSTADLAAHVAEAEAAAAAADPAMALWKTIKGSLTGDGGAAYFDANVKDALLPPPPQKFKGHLISAKPEIRPKELHLAVEKPDVEDCVLKLAEDQTPWAGKMDPGGVIEFQGTAKSFTKEPYILTLEVEKDKVTGWTGKNVPAAKKGAATKKQ